MSYEHAQGKTENKMTTSTAYNQVWPWRALKPKLTVVKIMGAQQLILEDSLPCVDVQGNILASYPLCFSTCLDFPF